MSKLTEKQEAFVHHITRTLGAIGNASQAAILAGYSKSSAKEIGYQNLHNKNIQQAIFETNQKQISGSLASLAVNVLREIIEDENAPQKIRLDAARTILDRSGIIAPKAEEPVQKIEKDFEDMSVEELQDFIRGRKKIVAEAGVEQSEAVH